MAVDVQRTLDFGNSRKIINLPDPTSPQDPATMKYVDSVAEGLKWKDSVRVATQANLNLSSPGSTIDSVTMVSGDRVLVQLQTAGQENGIYIWNGASVVMTRALDANTAAELNQAVVTVGEGTSAGSSYRQSVVNITLETTVLIFAPFGVAAGPASETSAGVVELATQTEVNTGTDTSRAVTPAGLAGSVYASKKYAANIGDGSATSYAVTHNLGTRDVLVEVVRTSGAYDTVLVEVQRTDTNTVTILFDAAPTSNAFRVLVRG